MSIEKLPNYQPILVRPKGDNILPGGNEIEVWQTQGKGTGLQTETYSQNTIAVPDEEGTKFKHVLRAQYEHVKDVYGTGQDQLASEYADLPLRTDTVLAEINGKVVDAKVYDYFKGEDGETYGAVVDNEGNYTGVKLDVLRGEYQKELRASHQGEAVLEAAGVDEPGINPWSPEAAKQREEATMPTFENPHMFDSMEDLIESVVFTGPLGEELRGDKVGWFKRDGSMFFLIEPTAESRRKAEFSSKLMAVPAEATTGLTPAYGPEVPAESADAQSSTINGETTERKPEVEADPFDALSPEAQSDVKRYRQAQQNKRDSERDKDFAQAAEDGRTIYDFGKRMSREAQEFVGFKP